MCLLTVATAVLAIAAALAILAAENILNRAVQMLRCNSANILAEAKRIIYDLATTAED